MIDRVDPAQSCIREAVCIHTKKIYDSCRDKDCVEDLRVYPTRSSQAVLDRTASVRGTKAELLCAHGADVTVAAPVVCPELSALPVTVHRRSVTAEDVIGKHLVIDATGIESCIQMALRLARKGGTVMLAGYGRGKQMSIRMDDIHINNLRVIGAGNNWNQHKKAISLIADGVIDVRPMISRRIRLEQFEEGIEMVRTRPEGFVKAVFVHG